MKYKHLTIEERYQISALKKAGYKQKDIAKTLGVSDSTICREFARNSSVVQKRYSPKSADNVAKDRRAYASKRSNKKMNSELKSLISQYINEEFSPEQTSQVIKARHNLSISYVRIYQYIEQDKVKGGRLHTHLRFYHTGKRRAKYGSNSKIKIKDRVSISQRPNIVNDKSRIGDWEIDTIIGSSRAGAIATVVERSSMFVKISFPTTKKANDIEIQTKSLLKPFKDRVLTITSDNGLEFANHKNISKTLECDWYFCHPYSSWERGLNEYTNGLVRQYIPKGTSFENITAKDIKKIENKLNHRPRKSLNWKTPYEVFYGLEVAA